MRPPNSKIARDPQVQAAAESVVRVLGTACGLGVQGSGWIAGDGVIVTNAHVVAGQDDTTVQLEGAGPRHDADVILFDVENDVAVLRSSGVSGTPALAHERGRARRARRPAILGFPENGPYDVQPGRLGATVDRADAGRLRPRPGPAPDHRRCAGSCATATPAGRWSTAAAGW